MLLDPPGYPVSVEALQTSKGRAFADLLNSTGPVLFAAFVAANRRDNPGGDVIIVRIQVERPQNVVNAIRHEETLAVTFFDSDTTFPEVLALRPDFPWVSHTNLREKEFPRNLCLYDQPYEAVKLDWTPAKFLFRIRHWLAKTATGTLHGDDQPLEPLIQGAPQRLILSTAPSLNDVHQQATLIELFSVDGPENELTLIAQEYDPKLRQRPHCVAAIFSCDTQTHGVIRHQPENVAQLDEFCVKAGLDLAAGLTSKVKN